MDAATIATICAIAKTSKGAIEYLVKDQRASFGLLVPAHVVFKGKAIGRGNFDNGILKISTFDGGNAVRLDASCFPASARIWNGPDIIPNDWKDGSFEMSLWHDLIWKFSEKIAYAWGVTATAVRRWANGILAAAWKGYSKLYPEAEYIGVKVRVAYGATNFTASWWHKFTRLFAVLLLAVSLSGCAGCAAPPNWEMTDSSGPLVIEEEVE